MSSRISYDYDYDKYSDLDAGRWERNVRAVFEGKRGQKLLRELEAALLDLPEPRLSQGLVLDLAGGAHGVQACALGAIALRRGVEVPDWLNSEGADAIAEWAQFSLGLTFTAAWRLMELNDEEFSGIDDEGRYEGMLQWVRARLHAGDTSMITINAGETAQ